MNNQRAHWDKIHEDGELSHYKNPSDFANEVLKNLKPNSKILELGCGVGNDSIAFANSGHSIIATDFSNTAIKKNKERFDNINLEFKIFDISNKFPFEENTFDLVYARLSLHYFKDQTTKMIFAEIRRVLKPNGKLAFICKSTKDPLYGKGTEIEQDMFEYKGHIRHFFSEDYTNDSIKNLFEINLLESGQDKFYGRKSSYVKVIAKKIK